MDRIRTTALLALVVAAAGCRDMGLEGNIPLAEAVDRPPLPLVAAVTATRDTASRALIVDGQLWVPFGSPQTLRESDLRPIGSAAGHTVHARSWDQPPYDAVFVRVAAPETPVATTAGGTTGGTPGGAGGGMQPAAGDERWQPFAPVVGRSGGAS